MRLLNLVGLVCSSIFGFECSRLRVCVCVCVFVCLRGCLVVHFNISKTCLCECGTYEYLVFSCVSCFVCLEVAMLPKECFGADGKGVFLLEVYDRYVSNNPAQKGSGIQKYVTPKEEMSDNPTGVLNVNYKNANKLVWWKELYDLKLKKKGKKYVQAHRTGIT